jgi:ABC-type polysaccharide transport system permease subunit
MLGAIMLFSVCLHSFPQLQQLEVSPWERLYKFNLVPRMNSYHIANNTIAINIHTDNAVEIVVCLVHKIRICVFFTQLYHLTGAEIVQSI